MFNIKEYLEKGIIENYCLGLASEQEVQQLMEHCNTYPKIKTSLEKTQKSMESFMKSYQRKPSLASKTIIKNNILENIKLETISIREEDGMLPEFIKLSRHTDIEKLEVVLENLQPPAGYGNIYVKPLFISKEKELILMWGNQPVPDEMHPEIDECFLVLEGTMDCVVEGEIFEMERGDFMRIPPNASHHVTITSSTPAKAIRSRVGIA